MSKQNNAKKILEQIKKEDIRPKPKWVYLVKNSSFWLLFAISVIFGSISIGTIFFSIFNTDWDVYKMINKSFPYYFLMVLPYFWLLILIAFIFFAYKNYKQTKTGYRTNPFLIVSYSIFGSIFIGTIFYLIGFGQLIESKFSDNIPHYKVLFERRMLVWNNPENGLLAGEITDLNDDNFYIKSLSGDKWKIIDDTALWKRKIDRSIGKNVKIIGKKIGSDLFLAKEIRPWIGKCMNMHGKCGYRH